VSLRIWARTRGGDDVHPLEEKPERNRVALLCGPRGAGGAGDEDDALECARGHEFERVD
jgi:hypothetical protein